MECDLPENLYGQLFVVTPEMSYRQYAKVWNLLLQFAKIKKCKKIKKGC